MQQKDELVLAAVCPNCGSVCEDLNDIFHKCRQCNISRNDLNNLMAEREAAKTRKNK